jgi:hypothetical protein
MTRDKANELLDAWRAGDSNIAHDTVRRALIATGDLCERVQVPFVDQGRPEGWRAGPRVWRAERREREAA